MSNFLEVKNLSVRYASNDKLILNNISFSQQKGSILGIVGESGSGKTTLLHSIIGLSYNKIIVENGEIIYKNKDLNKLTLTERKKMLGNDIGIIVQDSISSLNPIKKVSSQFIDLMSEKFNMDKKMSLKSAKNILKKFKCSENILQKYPFQLSGGQRQRVVIAMTFLLKPDLLLADEPTTALDVTTQSQILDEIIKMKEEYNTSVIIISHNLKVISKIADTIVVMKDGKILEIGEKTEILKKPKSDYTKLLIKCIPSIYFDKSKRLGQ